MRWKTWNWLDNGILPLTLTIGRVCSLWLWLALAQRLLVPSYQGVLLPAWLMAGLLLGGMAVTRWSVRRAGSLRQARLMVAGLGLGLMFLLLWWLFYRPAYPLWDLRWIRVWGQAIFFWVGELPPAYIVLPAIAYLWLRGIRDGGRILRYDDIRSAFVLGCIGLVVLMLLARLEKQALPAETGGVIFLFFAAAMIALALASLKTARVTANIEGMPDRPGLNRYWVRTVFGLITGLLGLGLLLSALFSAELAAQLLDWAWVLLSQGLIFLIKVVSLILYPVLLLLSYLMRLIMESLPGRFEEAATPEPDLSAWLQPGGPRGDPLIDLGQLPDGLRWVGLAIVILGLGAVFALVLQRLSTEDDEGIEEKREFIFSNELLLAQLLRLWSNWLRQSPGETGRVANPFLSLAGEIGPRQAIREVYQAMLAATRAQGQSRSPHQTPGEYEGALRQRWPEQQEALEVITSRYVQARYDAQPPSQEQVADARRAWEQFQATFRDQAGEE